MEVKRINGYNIKDEKARKYNNVEEIKVFDLKDGDIVETIGYYSANDGGGAIYKIREKQESETTDTGFIILLNNGLVAELIINDEKVNIKQLGATEENDINPYITNYLNFTKTRRIKLYIPYGTWKCSELAIDTWFDIVGDCKFTGNTIIRPLNEGQEYIFKLHNVNGYTAHWNLEGVQFESFDYSVNSCIVIDHIQYGYVTNVSFQNVKGRAMVLKNCWEITFTNIIARHVVPIVLGENYGVFQFENSSAGNISTLYFNYIQLEANIGNVFVVNSNVGVHNNHIGTINIESYGTTQITSDVMVSDISIEPISSVGELGSFSLFKLLDNSEIMGLTINSIDTNNLSSCLFKYNDKYYIYDTIFYKGGDISTQKGLNTIINAINFIGLKSNAQLLNIRNGKGNVVSDKNQIIINNVTYCNCSSYYAFFNCVTENNIQCNGIINEPNDFNKMGINEIYKIANKIEMSYGSPYGLLKYDPDSLSNTKLVCYPYTTRGEGGYFKIIGTNNTLKLRVKSDGSTTIQVYDENRSASTTYTIETTNGSYKWITIDLTKINGYQIGDTLQIGAGGGWLVYYDCYVMV